MSDYLQQQDVEEFNAACTWMQVNGGTGKTNKLFGGINQNGVIDIVTLTIHASFIRLAVVVNYVWNLRHMLPSCSKYSRYVYSLGPVISVSMPLILKTDSFLCSAIESVTLLFVINGCIE